VLKDKFKIFEYILLGEGRLVLSQTSKKKKSEALSLFHKNP